MATAIALSCEGVSKHFDILADAKDAWRIAFGKAQGSRFPALRDITLEVPKGKFVGVIGRNGAGKSTLLRALGGVYSPDSGAIRIRGDLSGLYELGLAGNPELSGRDYAQRILRLQGVLSRRMTSMITDIQEFSELGDRFDDPIYTYSAGMSARLFFATATAEQHDVYLIDEVLSVGDEHFQQKCWRRMRERLGGGASGVLVTHDWSAVLKLCETAHVLEYGRIKSSGPADVVVRDYLGQDISLRPTPGRARVISVVPTPIIWSSGEDAELPLTIEIQSDGPTVQLVYAVERMVVGVGWEIILNGIDLPVAAEKGTYRAVLKIPRLPLSPGRYQMALALVEVHGASPSDRVVLDTFGWLQQRPIEIVVEGRATAASTVLPIAWNIRAQ